MTFKTQYENAKTVLLNDGKICQANRKLFKEFFDFEEYKLKRKNNLPRLDEACYKTLYGYIARFRNVNRWFENKPWTKISESDLKRVYDDLEEGKIKNCHGEPFGDLRGYYNKVFRSKPFALAGKADVARKVMEFYTDRNQKEVRFITEDEFRKLVSVIAQPNYLLLFWLAWDIGENIGTLLQLKKRDFIRQVNDDTKETEYLVNLPREKLKRSRTSRSEPTLYPETTKYADIALAGLGKEDLVFRFGYRQASKVFKSAVNRSGAKSMPKNDIPMWKDLRSGMACHLLKQGWTTDEVNFRLGHRPSSRQIDVYVSYLAIDRRKPKKKIHDNTVQKLQNDVEEARQQQKLFGERLRRQTEVNEAMRLALNQMREDIQGLWQTVLKLQGAARGG